MKQISKYFPPPYNLFGGNVKIKLDLSNYVTKSDLNRTIGKNAPNLASNLDLGTLKAEVDKIDIDKKVTAPAS